MAVIKINPDGIPRREVSGVAGSSDRLCCPPVQRHIDERVALDAQSPEDRRTSGTRRSDSHQGRAADPAEMDIAHSYRQASRTLRLEADGSIGPMTDHVQHEGSSVHPVRQSGPHAHMIMFDPGNGDVLGGVDSDTIALFRFDVDKGTLELAGLAPTQGREPREFIFSTDGRFVIVASQDSDALVVMDFNEDGPQLRYRSSTPLPTPVCLRIA
jgi:hypothetical protein